MLPQWGSGQSPGRYNVFLNLRSARWPVLELVRRQVRVGETWPPWPPEIRPWQQQPVWRLPLLECSPAVISMIECHSTQCVRPGLNNRDLLIRGAGATLAGHDPTLFQGERSRRALQRHMAWNKRLVRSAGMAWSLGGTCW